LGISDKKNNSTEDGIDGTDGYFRRNSSSSAEQKILGIPFHTLLWKRKQLGTPFCGPKIKANFRNFLPNPSAEEKKTWNSVLWNRNRSKTLRIPFQTLQPKRKQLGIPFRGTKIEANSRNSVLNHSAEEKTTRNKTW
jgi:hypothetical protein